ncbi:MAG: glycosyltransferase [Verrucomicrobia bacterium]|nr:glycosyltransferase [Verrucomicrobiota bacterium]
MKILHIVADHAEHSAGVRSVLEAMAEVMSERGHEVTIAFTGQSQPDADRFSRTAFTRSFPKVLFYSAAMRRDLPGLVSKADVVHVHSNWTFPVWWGCRCAKRAGKRLVHSPHGCLDPLKLRHSAWKKRLATPFDRQAMAGADVILAASALEQSWIREWHPNLADRIQVIPFGIDTQQQKGSGLELQTGSARELCAFGYDLMAKDKSAQLHGLTPFASADDSVVTDKSAQNHGLTPFALFVGRLHPLKGLDLLLEAWAQTGQAGAGWELVIAGPDEQGTRAGLEKLAQRLGIQDQVRFPGPLKKEQVLEEYHKAAFVVLPSRSENFGMVVLEALASEVPVLATQNTPWDSLETESCGWWVPGEVKALSEGLKKAMITPARERQAMGRKGRAYVEQTFDWNTLAGQLEAVYR